MPGMNGLEAARIIRDPGSPVLRHDVPIIAVTAHALSDDRARGLAAGMNDYLVKPVVPVQLYRVVERYASSDAAVPSVLVERLKERLAATYFGDRDLADSIVRTFLEESPRLLKNIQDAAESEDLQSLQLHAHSLKSAAATIGLDGLQTKAFLLEQAARSGVMDDVPSLCRTIEEELNRFPVGNGKNRM
jgi:CheY-like chemotaxis protein